MGFQIGSLRAVMCMLSTFLIGTVSSYPTYVPNSPDVCSKMIPGHGPRPQTSHAPYKVFLNKQSVIGGNNLQIVIKGKKGHKFKGFYLQIRDIDGIPLGTFLSPDENEASAHGCFNQKNNAIHHKNRTNKDSITVYWKAPDNFEGQVRVIGTILKDFETYWTNVQAAEPVSVSNRYSDSDTKLMTSPTIPEKAAEESSKYAQTNRILKYNPYSPILPVWSSWKQNIQVENSSELLLSQPSEESRVAAHQRQLLGPANFDFHGGLYASKMAPLKSNSAHSSHNHLSHISSSSHGPSSINEQLPPLRYHQKYIPTNPFPHSIHHTNAQFYKTVSENQDIKERHPSDSHPNSNKPYFSQNLLPVVEKPYPFYPVDPEIQKNSVQFPSTHLKYSSHSHAPHFPQSMHDEKTGHYMVSHHYASPITLSPKPVYHPTPHMYNHRPASDPSYPNTGYFPKDILTRLTSFIPNIYNSLTNNPLFNFNVDNTIESIWRPSKGIPPQQPHSLLATGSTTSSSVDVEMPKYGYLVYNPVRGNPFYVIPAHNEDEFIANHLNLI